MDKREELAPNIKIEIESYGGAQSRVVKYAHTSVPVEGQRRVAMRSAKGDERYGINNWKKGDAMFILQRISHIQEHLLALKEDGNTKDDNTGAIIWGGYCLAWYEENKPEVWAEAMAMMHKYNMADATTSDPKQKK